MSFSRHQAEYNPPNHQEPQLEHGIQARPTLEHLTRTLPHTALSENKAAPTLEEEGKGEGRGGEGEGTLVSFSSIVVLVGSPRYRIRRSAPVGLMRYSPAAGSPTRR